MLDNQTIFASLTWTQLVIGLSIGFIPVAARLLMRRITETRRARRLADLDLLGRSLILQGKPALAGALPSADFGEVILVPPPPPARKSPHIRGAGRMAVDAPWIIRTKRNGSPISGLRKTSRARPRSRSRAPGVL